MRESAVLDSLQDIERMEVCLHNDGRPLGSRPKKPAPPLGRLVHVTYGSATEHTIPWEPIGTTSSFFFFSSGWSMEMGTDRLTHRSENRLPVEIHDVDDDVWHLSATEWWSQMEPLGKQQRRLSPTPRCYRLKARTALPPHSEVRQQLNSRREHRTRPVRRQRTHL